MNIRTKRTSGRVSDAAVEALLHRVGSTYIVLTAKFKDPDKMHLSLQQ